jgi:hypothetical protein
MSRINYSSINDTRSTSRAARAEVFDDRSHFGDVAMAMVPASLILAAATALMLAMF